MEGRDEEEDERGARGLCYMMCWLCIVPAMLCMKVALSAATAVRLLCSQSRLLHLIAETATDLMFHTV